MRQKKLTQCANSEERGLSIVGVTMDRAQDKYVNSPRG